MVLRLLESATVANFREKETGANSALVNSSDFHSCSFVTPNSKDVHESMCSKHTSY